MKTVIALSVIGILSLSMTGYIIYSNSQKQTVTTKAQEKLSPLSTDQEKMNTFKDEAGFSFDYPSSFEIKKADTLADNEYANLTISSSSVAGTILLKIVDTNLANTTDWVSSDPDLSTNSKATPIQFGTLNGSQIVKNNTYQSGVVNEGVLFTLATDGNNDQLVSTYKNILKTFVFVPVASAPATNTQAAPAADSDVVLDSEEEIQ